MSGKVANSVSTGEPGMDEFVPGLPYCISELRHKTRRYVRGMGKGYGSERQVWLPRLGFGYVKVLMLELGRLSVGVIMRPGVKARGKMEDAGTWAPKQTLFSEQSPDGRPEDMDEPA